MKINDKEKEIREKINDLDKLPNNINWTVGSGWTNYKKKYRTVSFNRIYFWISASAAVLLIAFLILYPSPNGKTMNIITQNEKMDTVLNDGSRIWINKHTKFSVNYKKELIAVHGEMYAELSGESEYRINTPSGSFIAANAHFNLKSAEQSKSSLLTVIKGNVIALWDEEKELVSIVSKGIQAKLIPKIALIQAPIEDQNYLAWKTGELHFNNTPLFYVIQKLEELNQTQIVTKGRAVRYCRLSESFKSSNAEVILKQLPKYLNCQVEKQGDTYFISGEDCKGIDIDNQKTTQ